MLLIGSPITPGSIDAVPFRMRCSFCACALNESSARAFVTSSAGAVFCKAHHLSEEVHQAMVSRGYTGQARTVSAFRVRTIDMAWIGLCAVVIVVAIGIDRALGR